jgi:hypothetical protein
MQDEKRSLKSSFSFPERRAYIRLNSVFPVEFKFVGLSGEEIAPGWHQGFTRDISTGGLCLTVNNLDESVAGLLEEKKAKLFLQIHVPLAEQASGALAQVAWIRCIKKEPPNQYVLGLAYEEISPAASEKIFRHALWVRNQTRFVFALAGAVILGIVFISGYNLRLRIENKTLVENLVETLKKAEGLTQQLLEVRKETGDLKALLAQRDEEISRLETKLSQSVSAEEAARLKSAIGTLSRERGALEARLQQLKEEEVTITTDLASASQTREVLEEANIQKMYQWLTLHQNPRTGLVISHEGDSALKDWAFTYDQSLAAQVYILFGDYDRAKKIFDFYRRGAERVNGGFVNCYYTLTGDVAEYIVHSGPNIWLGIALVQYYFKTGDPQYLPLAEEIAAWVISLQSQDPEAGIKGGPAVEWFSTEHNLDAYAFFGMLYKSTTREKYRLAQEGVFQWLKKRAYDRTEVPIRRGKGDSTIATDTYAWSIAAIGPQRLSEIGMDPDEIIRFAEENCAVSVTFDRPDGKTVRVEGFDFAKARHIPRGGIISPEWTAQMIVAYKIMAEFHHKRGNQAKSAAYLKKAQTYLGELGKLIISSPSRTGQGQGCLPYATQPYADTGHGWMTPKGNRTGSVAAVAYVIFAKRGYNPLEAGG